MIISGRTRWMDRSAKHFRIPRQLRYPPVLANAAATRLNSYFPLAPATSVRNGGRPGHYRFPATPSPLTDLCSITPLGKGIRREGRAFVPNAALPIPQRKAIPCFFFDFYSCYPIFFSAKQAVREENGEHGKEQSMIFKKSFKSMTCESCCKKTAAKKTNRDRCKKI